MNSLRRNIQKSRNSHSVRNKSAFISRINIELGIKQKEDKVRIPKFRLKQDISGLTYKYAPNRKNLMQNKMLVNINKINEPSLNFSFGVSSTNKQNEHSIWLLESSTIFCENKAVIKFDDCSITRKYLILSVWRYLLLNFIKLLNSSIVKGKRIKLRYFNVCRIIFVVFESKYDKKYILISKSISKRNN
jgi:hypothetical protein